MDMTENTVIELAKRERSSIVSTWTEHLTISRGQTKKYLIALAGYDALAEADDYFNEDKGEYELPTHINGQEVIGTEDCYVIGGALMINTDWLGLEFDDPGTPELTQWLRDFGWDNQVRVTDIKKALRWRPMNVT
jgi:hypothetical protein